jgi:hypothetical protein
MVWTIRKVFFFFFFISFSQLIYGQFEEGYSLYLFVYESDQTETGAGHIAIAFGEDTSHLIYYTKYRQQDGGGRKVRNLSYFEALVYDRDSLAHQKFPPSLVLKLKATQPDLEELEKLSDHWNLKKPWSLFVNNCTDAVKRLLRATKINPGLAFLISTPNELVEDLIYHNASRFKQNEFVVLHGDLCFYLKNERNAVPQALFGKRQKRNQPADGDCY